MDWKSHIEGLLSAGATVEQLATGMGVTPNAVREILAGRTRSPRADAAFRLAAMGRDRFSATVSVAALAPLIDSRMSKRALRAKFGFKTDAHLAVVLGVSAEVVDAWPEGENVPAGLVGAVQKLLGHEDQPTQQAGPQDPDEQRIVTLEVA